MTEKTCPYCNRPTFYLTHRGNKICIKCGYRLRIHLNKKD